MLRHWRLLARDLLLLSAWLFLVIDISFPFAIARHIAQEKLCLKHDLADKVM
jgi:hypothetical protein